VRIDARGGPAAPTDTFVSMRVGDVQKQSRFSDTRTYRFPKPSKGRDNFGRIEVFKRIGHMTVKFDDLVDGLKDVDVPCEFPGLHKLSMRLSVTGADMSGSLPQLQTKGGAKFKERKDAAQRYLDDHNLEDMLADAMKELIHTKPRDPHEFLSSHILKRSRRAPETKLPPMQPSKHAAAPELVPLPPRQRSRPNTRDKKLPPLPQSEKAAPVPLPLAQKVTPVPPVQPPENLVSAVAPQPLDNFSEYYKENFSSGAPPQLYSRFPPAVRKSMAPRVDLTDFKSYYKDNFPAAGGLQALYSKFASVPKHTQNHEPTIAVTAVNYYADNFGGTPYSGLHGLHSKFSAYNEAKANASAAAAPGNDFEAIASVGTWLAPRRPQLWQPFVLAEMPDPLPLQGERFKALPSVATWYSRPRVKTSPSSPSPAMAPQRKVEAKSDSFAMKPSVGSWLAARPKGVVVLCKPGGQESSGGAGVSSLANFSAYYKSNFLAVAMPSSVYSKFKPVAGPSKAIATQPSAANGQIGFKRLPSVGSWLALKPFPQEEPERPWTMRPSVGTWLSTRPPQQEEEEDRPLGRSMIERRGSELEKMSKEEVLTVVFSEIASKDREIEDLKAKLAKLELEIGGI